MFSIQCYEWKTSWSDEKIKGFVGFGCFNLKSPVRRMTLDEAEHNAEILRQTFIHLGFRVVSIN